jgi:hypothetical protein
VISNAHTVAPSNLGDLLESFKGVFALSALGKVPVQIGEQHLTGATGTPPRIIFIPEVGPGRIAGPLASGHHVASWVHACEVRIREKPGTTEQDVFVYAYALADKVIATLHMLGSGRIEWGRVMPMSPTKSNSMGAELSIGFTFQRGIPQWDRTWQLPVADESKDKPIQTARELANYTPAAAPTIEEAAEATPVIDPTVTPTEG